MCRANSCFRRDACRKSCRAGTFVIAIGLVFEWEKEVVKLGYHKWVFAFFAKWRLFSQAYFVTNMEPIKFWEFISLILGDLGYERYFLFLHFHFEQM
jgi:hypothetical protein